MHKFFKRRIIKNNCLLQQPSNFLTDEYYNPRKLRLMKIKINEIFTAKIFHNMKKLYKILFLGEGGGNFPGGFISGGNFPGGTFPGGIFPSTKIHVFLKPHWSRLSELRLVFRKREFNETYRSLEQEKYSHLVCLSSFNNFSKLSSNSQFFSSYQVTWINWNCEPQSKTFNK